MLCIVDQFGQMGIRFYHNFVSYQWLNNFFLLSELGLLTKSTIDIHDLRQT